MCACVCVCACVCDLYIEMTILKRGIASGGGLGRAKTSAY